jgi:di/tricarboxylate transporter
VPLRTEKGWIAVLITVLTLVAAASGLLPVAVAMMVGALCMVLTGCLAMDEAYRSVEWRAVFLLAGMLPVGIALDRSGAADWLGQVLAQTLAGAQPLVLVAGLFLLGTVLTQVVSGQVAAVILAPIAVAAARQTGAEPRSLAMATAMGCSMAFLTPTAHPVNILVMALGGYRVRDFLRVGLPLTLLLFLTLLLVLPAVRAV